MLINVVYFLILILLAANYYGIYHVNDSDSLVDFLKNVEPAYILSQTPFPFKPYSIDDRRVFTSEFIPVVEGNVH